ncbi:SMP-30/gluconolactonase/LRE family protein [Myceligenerans pegani]|uniref:SMP-30/gluconolactonase/LRE family protein n=1 Tax=Myceligenerans pegani TaxID=2776917 RepID=A0ABR9MWU1_9MICO|nr:SMP-30/gluconolactonase/LRE family protein [Myceligenerans sp. TRM 65318]MBE1875466.1 SMP-30/gluconolactonase/LRE family protein [Myceligenerans sp. TRM 65318]MBE3017737.1 SMP-30/gluconolactonase/LRE family protein [Myceligenerans sp. TRM 65318]
MSRVEPDGRRARRFRRVLVVVGALVVTPILAVTTFLLAVPTPVDGFDPESWQPGPGLTIADELTAPAVVEQLGDPIHGPEDIAMDDDGMLYTGDRSGTIWRVDPADGSAEIFARVGGRPLGLAFAPDGRLVVANHGLGLQAVDPAGRVEVLADTAGGAPILFANDLDVGPDGVVYLSDSSHRYNTTTLGDVPSYLLPDLLDGRAAGRLLSHDLRTGVTTVLLDGLYFPNGVAVTADGDRVWVAESNRYRILEHTLGGGTRTLLDDLPGTPDNIDRTDDGDMLIALYDRTAALDTLVLPSDLARRIMIRLPGGLFVNEEDPLTGGIVVADDDGSITAHHTGLAPAATSVLPAGGRWYLGALLGQPVRWMREPASPAG